MLDNKHTIKTTEYQYYDGLGRKSQTAGNAGNTTGNYVHTLQSYDSNGRPQRLWLPVAGGTTAECLSELDFEAASLSTYQDSHTYSEILGEYKANGNFRRLQRYGQKGSNFLSMRK